MFTPKIFSAAFLALMAYLSLTLALPVKLSLNATLATSGAITTSPYALTCANFNFQTSYIKGCHDFFLSAPNNIYYTGTGGVHLCVQTNHVYITGRGNDARASGLQIAYAISQLLAACGPRGGAVSANYEATTGKDFVVHVWDRWV